MTSVRPVGASTPVDADSAIWLNEWAARDLAVAPGLHAPLGLEGRDGALGEGVGEGVDVEVDGVHFGRVADRASRVKGTSP